MTLIIISKKKFAKAFDIVMNNENGPDYCEVVEFADRSRKLDWDKRDARLSTGITKLLKVKQAA